MQINRDFRRGLLVTVVFGITLFALIPAYIERPAFIPGFAPAPDMWPKVVTSLGLAMGLVLLAFSQVKRNRKSELSPFEWWMTYSVGASRLMFTLVAFAAFVGLVPLLGFLISSVLLMGTVFALTSGTSHLKWKIALTLLLPTTLHYFFAKVTYTLFPEGALLSAWGLV